MAKTTPNVRDLAEIEAPSMAAISTMTVLAGAQATAERQPGHSIGDAMLSGAALLTSRNLGVRLVYRLKDTRPLLRNEIAFWGGMLAALAPGDVDLVSHAPSSGKVPPGEHLATLLAQACAQALRKPFASVFVNEHQRGNRGSRTAKLKEAQFNPYRYVGPGAGALVLVVDDVVFTRSTARRCAAAALQGGDRVCFAVLYRA